jgi:hypothetical protein
MGYFVRPEGNDCKGTNDPERLKTAIRFLIDTFGGKEWVSDEEMEASLADFFERHPGEGADVWGPYLRAAKAILGVEPGC